MKLHRLGLPTANLALRALCAWAITVVVAQQSRNVFAHGLRIWLLIGSMTVCSLIAFVLIGQHWIIRMTTYALLAVGGVSVAVVGADGRAGPDTARALVRGLGDVLSAVWPAPLFPAGVGALSGLACLTAMLAVDLSTHKIAITGMLPSLGLLGLLALLAAPAGPPSEWMIGAYALGALALLRSQSSMRFSSTRLSLFGLLTLALAAVPVLFSSLATAERYDPRGSFKTASLPDIGISPLARLDEWRTRTPADAVLTSDLATATRWRLVGLTRYDGRTWMPAEDFRRSSDEIGPISQAVATTKVSVTLGDLDSFWYPAPQGTLNISLPVRIDGGISGFLADDRPAQGTTYSLVIEPTEVTPAQLSGARAAHAETPFINGVQLSPTLLQLATTATAGAQTDYERAERIASYLRKQFTLDDASPAGHSMVVEELFLLRTKRGRDEQFVSAYGLLAAAVGLPVRIAVGFTTIAKADGSGSVALSDGAIAWPEVNFEGFGWVPFDPIPSSEDVSNPDRGTGVIAPIADDASVPPPSTTPTSSDSLPTNQPPETIDTAAATDSGTSVRQMLVGASLGLALLIPLTYVAIVLWIKRKRRAARLAAEDPRDRAIGAFRTGVDTLVDLGSSAPASMTDRELVSLGAHTVGGIVRELEPMARLATEAVFRPQPLSASSVKSWQQLAEFERLSAEEVGRFRFWRSRLSMRSLRHDRQS